MATTISMEAIDYEIKLLSTEITEISTQLDTAVEKHRGLDRVIKVLTEQRAVYAGRKATLVTLKNHQR